MPRIKSSKGTSSGLVPALNQKQLIKVYRKIHDKLAQEVRSSKKEFSRNKEDKKLFKKYREAAQNLYAYIRLLELCDMLSKYVAEMKETIDVMAMSTLKKEEHLN